jgi:hypothetical protein
MDESSSEPAGNEESIEAHRRLLAEAKRVSRELGALSDDIVAQAESGRREAQRLIGELAEASAAIPGGEAVTPEPPLDANRGSDGARMLARQMLANGSDRAEVEQHLRTSFRVKDAGAVVDSVIASRGG